MKMISFSKYVAIMLLLLCLVSCDKIENDSLSTINDSKSLNIIAIAQQTPVWCWASVSEMTFRFYGLPNLNPGGDYQCGIVAAYFGPYSICSSSCYSCITGIGRMSDLQNLISGYGIVANQFGLSSRILRCDLIFSYLTIDLIAKEINSNRPIIAGISALSFPLPNASQHVTLIVGYDITDQIPYVIINDPFPYDIPQYGGAANPYLQNGGTEIEPGKYKITLNTFISNLNWANTIYHIQ